MSEAGALPARASAVVIGGGVMGCSTLYHLAKAGVRDAVLIERQQLTCGTTWHSAAQVRQLRSTRNLTRLIQHSATLYASLEAETGQSTGWYRSGSLSIATNPDRWTHIQRQTALARAYGVEAHEVTLDEVRSLWPLLNTEDVIGAVFSPDDGRVNPSDLCLALSKGARMRGARIFEHTPVTGFLTDGARVTGVRTLRGDIRTERVAICAGLWSRQLGLMAGAQVPLLPCEHFYLLTQPIDGIDGHLPTLSDHDAHLYIRDDVGGLLVGCFEPMGKPLDPKSLGDDFAFGLLNEDWDHFEPMLRNAIHRIPALEQAEARTLLNGPESFTPDGAFLLGESPDVPGLFLGCGMNSVGVASGGGAGWALAEWLAHGAPPFELAETDPARLHAAHNTLDGLMARAPEVLGEHYAISYPGRQFKSDRNLRLTPLHEEFKAAGARFGQVFAWERPQYFGASGEPALTFDRPAWFQHVADEVRAAHEACAVFDLSPFAKLRVTGRQAEPFLDYVCANDMSRAPGRAIYTAMLSEQAGYVSDFTAFRISDEEYLIYTGSGALYRDRAWLERHRSAFSDVTIEDVTESIAALAVMGPNAPSLLAQLGGDELSQLGYFRHAEVQLAGISVRAARVSYVGEAGFELSMRPEQLRTLYAALTARGARPAGLFAQTAMRIEKRYLAMGHDLDRDVTPVEAGLEFAVKCDREFIGADALARRRRDGAARRMVSVLLDDAGAEPLGDEPIYLDERPIGQATSAAFGHRVGRPVVLGYVDADALRAGEPIPVTVAIAGTRASGTASTQAAFDPQGTRLRG